MRYADVDLQSYSNCAIGYVVHMQNIAARTLIVWYLKHFDALT